MPEFPTPQALLGDLVSMKSYTAQGQSDIVEYIRHFNQRWDLGELNVHEFPESAKLSSKKDPKPRNITIDIGEGTEETVIFHGHFDTVPPEDYPKDFDRKPHELTLNEKGDVAYGLGTYDMLGGVASYLLAAKDLQVATHRKVRILLVWGEENQSEGTHAALHPENDLVGDASCLVSTEIPVGGELGDDPKLYIGRPGRIGLDMTIKGEAMHSNKVQRSMMGALTKVRNAVAILALKDLRFEEHQDDPHSLLPESSVMPGISSTNNPRSLSVVSRESTALNVFYSNPNLDYASIQRIVYDEIQRVLSDENFTLNREKGRVLPFTQPWLEDVQNPFVQIAQEYASKAYNRPVELSGARGVADEPIIVHHKNIPAVCFPPMGTGEHTRYECVNLPSIEYRVVPFLRDIAAHQGLLVEQ